MSVAAPRVDVKVHVAKSLQGKVVSSKMDKTAVVAVARQVILVPKYGKRQIRTTRFKMHDENNECNEGDIVRMKGIQRISKQKKYTLEKIIRKMEIV